MGFFDSFPFSNRHELNLDWIIQTIKSKQDKLTPGVGVNIVDNVISASPQAVNANLLVNPFFTICQRGAFPYDVTGNAPGADGWETNSGANATVFTGSGVRLYRNGRVTQKVMPAPTIGSHVTASVKFGDSVISTSAVVAETMYHREEFPDIIIEMENSTNGFVFSISCPASRSVSPFNAAKLEYGNTSTLLGDAPASPAETMMMCQRRVKRAVAGLRFPRSLVSANAIDFFFPVGDMDGTPIIDTSKLAVYTPAGVAQTGFAFTVQVTSDTMGVVIRASKTAHGLTDAYLQIASAFFITT